LTSSATLLRKSIESCELTHRIFREHFDALSNRADDAMNGYAPRFECLMGPSRVGKTLLLNALARKHPSTKIGGVRHVPLLVVPISASISPLLLPTNVLTALGMPLPIRGITSGVMFQRMADQLRLVKTKVILFEEASHLVEPSARLPPRAAGDWFKSVMDALGITVVLFGVPRLERLFASNEQLRLRASARRIFRPYDFSHTEDQLEFASCARTYLNMFEKAGWTSSIPIDAFVRNCYLQSGGLIGVLSHLMLELAGQLCRVEPRAITFVDLKKASAAIEGAGPPGWPAFSSETVSLVDLNQAHAYVLEINGLLPDRNSRTVLSEG
jgi:hypothetical protein